MIALVEQDNPYQLQPTMSAKERYDLRESIYSQMSSSEVNVLTNAIQSSASQLEEVLSDNRYQELTDPENKRWDAYDANNLFGIANFLHGSSETITYQPLVNDLNTVITLCTSGLKERNVLKLIDANRILQDLSRHLLQVPYQEGSDAAVVYGNLHDKYFKVTETLEGNQKLISNQ